MSRHRLLSGLAMAALCGLAVADPSGPPQDAAKAPPAPMVETVRVRLAQFDVVVRDRHGKIVSGLGPGDFEVLEHGQPLQVVAVDEWGAPPTAATPSAVASILPSPESVAATPPGATPEAAATRKAAPAERRSLVILFDNLNGTSALRMSQAKRAAKEFVRTNFRPGDHAAIYELDMALRAESGFSSDPAELALAIDKVTWMPTSSFEDDMTESIIAYRSSDTTLDQSRLRRMGLVASQVLDWQREHFYETVRAVSDLFGGLPGRRILVLLSSGFPMTTPGEISRQTGGFTPKFRDLVKALERNGVTVYSIDIGEDLTIGDVSKSIDWRNAAYRIGLDDAALEDMGLDLSLSSGSAGARRQVLGVLAGETGGRLLTQSDFRKAFEVIDEESTRFYRLSCKVPEERKDARYRAIVVSVPKPGTTVTARRGRYGDVIPGLVEEREIANGVVDNLARYRTISVRGSAETLPGGSADGVPVVVVVEALGPIAFPPDDANGAKIDLDFNLVARAGGEIVRRYSRSLSARVKPEGVGAVRRSFRVEGRLQLPPGHYDVQANLRINEPPQFGSWVAPVTVAPPPADGALRFAGLLLAEPEEGAAPLLPTWKPTLGQADPLQLKDGLRLLPSTHSDYGPGDVLALFWLRGLLRANGESPKLDIGVHVTDVAGGDHAVQSRMLMFRPDGSGGDLCLVSVSVASLPAGAYALRLEARDLAADSTAEIRASFAVNRAEQAPAPPASARPKPEEVPAPATSSPAS
jgi:VWFA-related protein